MKVILLSPIVLAKSTLLYLDKMLTLLKIESDSVLGLAHSSGVGNFIMGKDTNSKTINLAFLDSQQDS